MMKIHLHSLEVYGKMKVFCEKCQKWIEITDDIKTYYDRKSYHAHCPHCSKTLVYNGI